ncbi:hypothetical protein BDQ12DRAFT_691701 [Crucibulum laeve]|uniref:Uncharacterized protein n=1 Tax=Crucibulum laeve TaxID=68775 RepID=A0A5C3LIU2_9AGAR|nr:hypothetical protein BDQ12DRAFT_691701 [Crucibulum laeve]
MTRSKANYPKQRSAPHSNTHSQSVNGNSSPAPYYNMILQNLTPQNSLLFMIPLRPSIPEDHSPEFSSCQGVLQIPTATTKANLRPYARQTVSSVVPFSILSGVAVEPAQREYELVFSPMIVGPHDRVSGGEMEEDEVGVYSDYCYHYYWKRGRDR